MIEAAEREMAKRIAIEKAERPNDTTVYLSCADTARIVRVALKAEFPITTFSVRSKTYSGGASIRVRYTDGPAEKMVEKVVREFSGAHFDGMIDLKSSIYTEFNGQRLHHGADFIFVDRTSDKMVDCRGWDCFWVGSREEIIISRDHNDRIRHLCPKCHYPVNCEPDWLPEDPEDEPELTPEAANFEAYGERLEAQALAERGEIPEGIDPFEDHPANDLHEDYPGQRFPDGTLDCSGWYPRNR